jgi:hypothetical protein
VHEHFITERERKPVRRRYRKIALEDLGWTVVRESEVYAPGEDREHYTDIRTLESAAREVGLPFDLDDLYAYMRALRGVFPRGSRDKSRQETEELYASARAALHEHLATEEERAPVRRHYRTTALKDLGWTVVTESEVYAPREDREHYTDIRSLEGAAREVGLPFDLDDLWAFKRALHGVCVSGRRNRSREETEGLYASARAALGAGDVHRFPESAEPPRANDSAQENGAREGPVRYGPVDRHITDVSEDVLTSATRTAAERPTGVNAERHPRPFDAGTPPAAAEARGADRDPGETLALQEKARQAHHRLLAKLAAWLSARGWTQIEEIPAAIDLWACRPDGRGRVIFEAKTVRDGTEIQRTRSALAQLIEYRLFFASDEDELCVVVDAPVSDRRCRVLDSLGIGVLVCTADEFVPGSASGAAICD